MSKKQKYGVWMLVVALVLPGNLLWAQKRPSTMAELALYKGADRQKILEEGAKKEGTLTFYTSGILAQAVRPVIEAFEKKYPFIKVNVWRASSVALISRAVEEFKTGKHLFDAMEGTQTNMQVIQSGGLVQSYYVPNLEAVDEEAVTRAPDGGIYAAAFRSSGIGVGFNTRLITKDKLPKTYDDLLHPLWKGKMPIAGSDTGVNWAGAIYHAKGEEFLKKVAQQNFVVHMVSARAILDLVIAGEYVASPTVFDSHVLGSLRSGAPVGWIPLEPVRVNVGQIAVAKHAPHPHAALLFADFELSKESGEIHREVGYDSFRKDVATLEQKYKKYFGQTTMEGIEADHERFGRLFTKK